ncbi:MAG TPA: pyrroloquinoline quinone-dependent dehydrogenase, partial [Terriglobia bacterium]|nr:pyrroloquinoline quinone-dependent dehydrogenase [Terriglobia bacterium]
HSRPHPPAAMKTALGWWRRGADTRVCRVLPCKHETRLDAFRRCVIRATLRQGFSNLHALALLCTLPLLAWSADLRSFATWTQYGGGADSSQYSSLKQINKSNVSQLELAWTYPTADAVKYNFNPLVAGSTMYVLAKNNSIVALDAATGNPLWTHANQGSVAARGMNYWESEDRADRRLLYFNAGYLTAIDARTGQTVESFGDRGRVDLRIGLDRDVARPLEAGNPGRIFENIMIVSLPAPGLSYDSPPADIHGYDVRTGKLLWVFHTVPHPGEPGYETWPPEAWKTSGGVHDWSELTIDPRRGIAYIPLGTARYDFFGGNRKGDDLFGNCLLALDVRTGKRLWHFQLVHHDLWDYDLPTAPKLLTLKHNGATVDAVAQPTKQGFLFVFNRATGEPLWPIEERRVPQSDVPGEFSSPTQPFPTRPPPFARQSFTEKDIDPYIPEADQARVRELLKNSRNEGLYTPPSLRGSIEMPGHNGGANWGSSAVDPEKGMMFIVSKELPTLLKLVPPGAGPGPGGRGSEPRGGAGEAVSGSAPAASTASTAPMPENPSLIRYTSPINFLFQSNGLSAIGPPWSQLTAYDLNTGDIQWQVPNGGVNVLAEQGHRDTGAHFPRGGVVVTAGGLIFVATASDRKIRAYDEDTGKVLWEKDLPAASEGIPAVYAVGGREYLTLCVAAADGYFAPKLGAPKAGAGAYVTFALPKN